MTGMCLKKEDWNVDCGISFPRERKTKILFTSIFQTHSAFIFNCFPNKLNHMSIIKYKKYIFVKSIVD